MCNQFHPHDVNTGLSLSNCGSAVKTVMTHLEGWRFDFSVCSHMHKRP